MTDYDKIKKILALGFMRFLDENRTEEKMCLSNGECTDIEKAFNEQDWSKLVRYLDKYRKSEDERVIQFLINWINENGIGTLHYIDISWKEQILAWLEKQKEQKHPDGCFTCDEYKKGYEAGRLHGFTAGYNKAMKEQKPAEWSEEDGVFIRDCANLLELEYPASAERLRKLRPRWKPSEEQMEELLRAITPGAEYDCDVLNELYEQLNRLKG